MTVELHTFTRNEIETVLDALRIAAAQYHANAEGLGWLSRDMRQTLMRQAAEAGSLRLRIEASL